MKIKKGFVLRDVAGRSVVVATGAAAKKFRGMIMLNDTGKEIWIRLQKGMDQEEIIRSMVTEIGCGVHGSSHGTHDSKFPKSSES